jgi:hypothetical protein
MDKLQKFLMNRQENQIDKPQWINAYADCYHTRTWLLPPISSLQKNMLTDLSIYLDSIAIKHKK